MSIMKYAIIGVAMCTVTDVAMAGHNREPYRVKVDPPVCEIVVVSSITGSECRNHEEDYGPGIPADGDAWGCFGAGASAIRSATATGNIKTANTRMFRRWKIRELETALNFAS